MDFVLIYSYVNHEYHLIPVTGASIGPDAEVEVLYEFDESELVIANRILHNLRLERSKGVPGNRQDSKVGSRSASKEKVFA